MDDELEIQVGRLRQALQGQVVLAIMISSAFLKATYILSTKSTSVWLCSKLASGA